MSFKGHRNKLVTGSGARETRLRPHVLCGTPLCRTHLSPGETFILQVQHKVVSSEIDTILRCGDLPGRKQA